MSIKKVTHLKITITACWPTENTSKDNFFQQITPIRSIYHLKKSSIGGLLRIDTDQTSHPICFLIFPNGFKRFLEDEKFYHRIDGIVEYLKYKKCIFHKYWGDDDKIAGKKYPTIEGDKLILTDVDRDTIVTFQKTELLEKDDYILKEIVVDYDFVQDTSIDELLGSGD